MHTGSPVQGNGRARDSSSRFPHPRHRASQQQAERANGRNTDVNKSVLAISGIGVAGCVLLSVMMKELVAHKPAKRPAWLVALESEYREQLVGPLATHEEDEGGAVRAVVFGAARAGSDRSALALAIANSAARLLRDANALTEVQVTLHDPDGKQPQSALVPRARPPR